MVLPKLLTNERLYNDNTKRREIRLAWQTTIKDNDRITSRLNAVQLEEEPLSINYPSLITFFIELVTSLLIHW
jgi:hypothetical protein